jgi:hypothetical protein
MRVCPTDISQETRDALKKELGETARNRPPKGMSPDDFVDYLKERYKNSPDGVLFREGTRHRRASVDGGINWISLGERHPSRAIKDTTVRDVIRQLDGTRMLRLQAQRNEKNLDTKQWAEEVRSLNLLRKPKIYEAPNEDGSYTGSILYKDPSERYCVQKLNERAIVLHDAQKFPDGLPEKENVVRINYQSGIAEFVVIKTRTHERDGR